MVITKDKMAAHSKKGKNEKNKYTLKPNQNLEVQFDIVSQNLTLDGSQSSKPLLPGSGDGKVGVA